MKYQIVQNDVQAEVTLVGDISHDIKETLEKVYGEIKVKQIDFNCEFITKINSVGIAEWMLAMNLYKGMSYGFSKCTENFFITAVIVPTFPADGKIVSFFSTYSCPDCDIEDRILFQVGPNVIDEVAEPRPCRSCGGEMEVSEAILENLEVLSERNAL